MHCLLVLVAVVMVPLAGVAEVDMYMPRKPMIKMLQKRCMSGVEEEAILIPKVLIAQLQQMTIVQLI